MDATGSRKKEQYQKDSRSGCSFASLLGCNWSRFLLGSRAGEGSHVGSGRD